MCCFTINIFILQSNYILCHCNYKLALFFSYKPCDDKPK